jgi:hypothetical protein
VENFEAEEIRKKNERKNQVATEIKLKEEQIEKLEKENKYIKDGFNKKIEIIGLIDQDISTVQGALDGVVIPTSEQEAEVVLPMVTLTAEEIQQNASAIKQLIYTMIDGIFKLEGDRQLRNELVTSIWNQNSIEIFLSLFKYILINNQGFKAKYEKARVEYVKTKEKIRTDRSNSTGFKEASTHKKELNNLYDAQNAARKTQKDTEIENERLSRETEEAEKRREEEAEAKEKKREEEAEAEAAKQQAEAEAEEKRREEEAIRQQEEAEREGNENENKSKEEALLAEARANAAAKTAELLSNIQSTKIEASSMAAQNASLKKSLTPNVVVKPTPQNNTMGSNDEGVWSDDEGWSDDDNNWGGGGSTKRKRSFRKTIKNNRKKILHRTVKRFNKRHIRLPHKRNKITRKREMQRFVINRNTRKCKIKLGGRRRNTLSKLNYNRKTRRSK